MKLIERYKIGDDYLGIKLFAINSEFLQHHIDINIYPVKMQVSFVPPFRNLAIEIAIFKIYIKLGVGKNED